MRSTLALLSFSSRQIAGPLGAWMPVSMGRLLLCQGVLLGDEATPLAHELGRLGGVVGRVDVRA